MDPVELGDQWLRKTGRMMDRAMAVVERRPEVFVHVRYQALLRTQAETLLSDDGGKVAPSK